MQLKNGRYYLEEIDIKNDTNIDLNKEFVNSGINANKNIDIFLRRVTNSVYTYIEAMTVRKQDMVDRFNSDLELVKGCLEEQVVYMVQNGDSSLMSGLTNNNAQDNKVYLQNLVSLNVKSMLNSKHILYRGLR